MKKKLGTIKLNIDVEDLLYNAEIDWNYKIPQVIQDSVYSQVRKAFAEEINQSIKKEIEKSFISVKEQLSVNILDFEFNTPGVPNEKTTPRIELSKSIKSMIGHWSNSCYMSDKSPWQIAVESAVKTELGNFKVLFTSQVIQKVTDESKVYATDKMKQLLGVK